MHLAFLIARRPSAAALLLVAALASPAGAVVISASSDTPNLLAPGSNPLWSNVGRVNTASGVYLGNRWVITANHVGSGSLRLSDGREFAASVGSGVRLQNIGGLGGSPDLWMFRVAADPLLDAAAIAVAAPEIGTQVMMIGAGVSKSPQLTGWQTTPSPWTEVPLTGANALGFSLLSDSAMRWGMNQVATGPSFGADQTIEISTRFDRFGLPFEAQATVGDSGGGVFHQVAGAWELSGIMLATQLLPGQPQDTVVFGDQTFLADLSGYRDEILGLVNGDEPLWQNQVNHYDVSGSGRVEPRDLLLVVNELLGTGTHALEGAPGSSGSLFDVNGDYRVSPADAQQIVNALLGGLANPASSAAPAGVNFVSEPSTAVLALGGMLLFALMRAVTRRRRGLARGR